MVQNPESEKVLERRRRSALFERFGNPDAVVAMTRMVVAVGCASCFLFSVLFLLGSSFADEDAGLEAIFD